MALSNSKRVLAIAALSILSACGGSSFNDEQQQSTDQPNRLLSATTISGDTSADNTFGTTSANTLAATTASGTATATMTPQAAAHFLSQATFGPTSASIAELSSMGTSAWLNAQFAMPQSWHLGYLDYYTKKAGRGAATSDDFQGSFWQQALYGKDQLRQRVAFALSQIFVISTKSDHVYEQPQGVAHYYDMLAYRGFGNFRDLLEGVALSPVMGIYLSHIHNVKETDTRTPDENFAREIMQLMSIGLYQLNQDGSLKLTDGKPMLTYSHEDVMGLAKVFTGWSWAGPDQSESRFLGFTASSDRALLPMQNYTAYHSTSAKSFLGVTIAAGTPAAAELKIALDTLFNHPNVGPFIGRQLIQRLVSSNPSPAYISRVAAAFNNNGKGVRGDMKAVIRAVLLDPEATEAAKPKKLREPVLRMANFLRAFNATSKSGWYFAWSTGDVNNGLGMSVLQSPSVFNFYRPGYAPPGSALANAGMVGPELQITSGPSTAGYLNFLQQVIQYGFGKDGDIQPNYSKEWELAPSSEQLLDRVNLLLMAGAMSNDLRNQILSAMNSIPYDPKPWNGADTTAAKKNRTYLAIYLTMASPEYLVQK